MVGDPHKPTGDVCDLLIPTGPTPEQRAEEERRRRKKRFEVEQRWILLAIAGTSIASLLFAFVTFHARGASATLQAAFLVPAVIVFGDTVRRFWRSGGPCAYLLGRDL